MNSNEYTFPPPPLIHFGKIISIRFNFNAETNKYLNSVYCLTAKNILIRALVLYIFLNELKSPAIVGWRHLASSFLLDNNLLTHGMSAPVKCILNMNDYLNQKIPIKRCTNQGNSDMS